MTRTLTHSCIVLSLIALLLGLSVLFGIGPADHSASIVAHNLSQPAVAAGDAISRPKQQGLDGPSSDAINAAFYRVRAVEQTKGSDPIYYALNPAQRISACFTPEELRIEDRELWIGKTSRWRMSMKLVGYGYGEHLTHVGQGDMKAKDNRVEINRQPLTPNPHPPITEWYLNNANGIEQGFTLASPPPGKRAEDLLRLRMKVTGDLKPSLTESGQAIVLATKLGEPVLRYDRLSAFDASGRKLSTHMELVGEELSLVVDDAGATYPVTIDPFLIQIKKLTASDGAANDQFGQAVALSGNTTIVGAPLDDVSSKSNQGSAYIFERSSGGANNWGEVKHLIASDGASHNYFGWSVTISGDTAVVGAFQNGGLVSQGLGAVYIFERNAGGANNWGEVKKLKAGNPAGSFGWSVSISETGNTIVVGAPGGVDPIDIGEAYIFDRNQGGANNWGLVKKLTASDPSSFDFFGHSVSISGDTIVAGTPGGDNGPSSDQGAAYIFERNQGGANNWGQTKKLTASDGAMNDQFGVSVSVSGNTIVAGAYLDDVDSNVDQGSAYIFDRNQGGANNWGQVKKLAVTEPEDDFFGYSVMVSGDRIVAGRNSNVARHIYLFDRNQGGANNWGQFQKLSPLDDQFFDFFGRSVALSGGTVVAGAMLADIGSNTNQGAAYIFDSVAGPNPAIIAGSITVQQGGSSFGVLAEVADDVTPPGNLMVQVISSPSGITVTGLINDDGEISVAPNFFNSSRVDAACSVPVGSYSVVLQVTDGDMNTATANLTVNVTANNSPTLGDYPATTVSLGASAEVFPSTPPSDENKPFFRPLTASAPGFTGTLSSNNIGQGGGQTGAVTITNAGPPGTYTVTVTATDQCGLSTSKTFTLTVLSQVNTLVVNTASDTVANDGFCSCREAITSANTHMASGAASGECVAGVTGTDLITFNIPGAGPHTISPNSALPNITEPLIIDGLTQPGAVCNTWPPTLKIVLNGANAGAAHGLTFNTFNSLARGLVINQFSGNGIQSSGNGNTFQCNFVGTDVTGTVRLANGFGIATGFVSSNLVGGTAPGTRNLISGNGTGIAFGSNPSTSSSNVNRAEGNFIGTDVTGTLDLGNTVNGISAGGTPGVIIGGTTPEARNIISGNDQNGIVINSFTINRPARVFGNYIGTDVTGSARLGNGLNGVLIMGNINPIGGANPSFRNVISANGGAGIKISGALNAINNINGNFIGTDATGALNLGNALDGIWITDSPSNFIGSSAGNLIAFNSRDGVRVEGSASTGNRITLNSIFNNAGLGINLGSDAVTPNDAGDADVGPNNLQNFPVLTSTVTDGSSLTIHGTLNSRPSMDYTIQFFSNDACDQSGNGEGKVWLGDVVVTTDGTGDATIDTVLPVAVSPGKVITATATLTASSDGTSEFSACRLVQGIGPVACALTCPPNLATSNTPGQCGAVVNYSALSSSGDCGNVNCSPASGSFFPIGTTKVTCNADSGESCSFMVTVNETQPPQITCPNNITTSGNKCAVVNYKSPTVSDNCPGVGTPSCNPQSGTCFPVGTTTVTCSVTDASKNQASCSFTVTVNPQGACSITCPANVTKSNDPNQCGAVVTYPAPNASGCGTVSCSPASGSFFPKGTTTVTCTTTAGPSCTFTVTVNDTQPPSITCPAAVTSVTPDIGGSNAVVTYPPPTATDNCPGVTSACNPPSGSMFPTGCTTVTCTATDTSGNTATCTFKVCVFNICLQDDSNSQDRILINTMTGDYRFCCNGVTYTGKGKITTQGSTYTLEHNPLDRRVRASVTAPARSGNASLQSPPGKLRCNITDSNTANNTSCTSCH